MPRTADHWAYDLAALLAVVAVVSVVFWVLPVQARPASPGPGDAVLARASS